MLKRDFTSQEAYVSWDNKIVSWSLLNNYCLIAENAIINFHDELFYRALDSIKAIHPAYAPYTDVNIGYIKTTKDSAFMDKYTGESLALLRYKFHTNKSEHTEAWKYLRDYAHQRESDPFAFNFFYAYHLVLLENLTPMNTKRWEEIREWLLKSASKHNNPSFVLASLAIVSSHLKNNEETLQYAKSALAKKDGIEERYTEFKELVIELKISK